MTKSAESGHNSESVAAERIKSFVSRIERMEEEKKGISDDIKDIYAEIKGIGLDVKTIKKLVKLRKIETQNAVKNKNFWNFTQTPFNWICFNGLW